MTTLNNERQEIKASPEIRRLKVEIKMLTPEVGDVLAVIFKERITYQMADLIISDLKRDLPKGVHVIIFAEDVKLAVIKPFLGDGPEYALAKRGK